MLKDQTSMKLTIDALIDNDLTAHARATTLNKETLTYYVDKSSGIEVHDRYISNLNEIVKFSNNIKTINIGHNQIYHEFIQETFIKLDKLIDLDFEEMSHNNGSMLDIYHVSYSSQMAENVVGQAITQESENGSWWDIFWKENPQNLEGDINSDLNTIIHEIGHSLGLSHPFNDGDNESWTSSDTIMSYNEGHKGWDTWFSETDLNALFNIWGRENDLGKINYDGISTNYKFKRTNDQKYFIKTIIGYEDVTDIKTLNFLDKSMEVKDEIIDVFNTIKGIDDITGKIYRLYNAAFARFPDKVGLDYWINNNKSGQDTYKKTAESFLLSEEFINLYGSSSNNEAYIKNLYSNVLERLPDNEGFNYWLNQIEKGVESKNELLMGFAESSESKLIFSAETGIL